MRTRLTRRTALAAALLSALLAAAKGSHAQDSEALGLCPASSRSVDSYVQSLCEGEAALRSGKATEALALFTAAALTPRIEAAHELAWAGLAIAHCQNGEFARGQQWAEHFGQARRLWLGELDCELPDNGPGRRIDPFVRGRMCSESLAADYALVRRQPDAAHTIDLKLRLARIESMVQMQCAQRSTAPQAVLTTATQDKAQSSGGKVARKKKRRAPARRPSGTPGSPAQGR